MIDENTPYMPSTPKGSEEIVDAALELKMVFEKFGMPGPLVIRLTNEAGLILEHHVRRECFIDAVADPSRPIQQGDNGYRCLEIYGVRFEWPMKLMKMYDGSVRRSY